MLCKSLVTKIKSQTKKEIIYYCKVGQKLAIISLTNGNPEDFYLVINVRNEVFTLLRSELESNNFIEPIIAFNKNRIHLFEDYVLPKFEL